MTAISPEWALAQPIVNERDERLVSVIDIDEGALHMFSPVTFALVIARDPAGFLLILNSRRGVWSCPADSRIWRPSRRSGRRRAEMPQRLFLSTKPG
jgi:hypothetical protein